MKSSKETLTLLIAFARDEPGRLLEQMRRNCIEMLCANQYTMQSSERRNRLTALFRAVVLGEFLLQAFFPLVLGDTVAPHFEDELGRARGTL